MHVSDPKKISSHSNQRFFPAGGYPNRNPLPPPNLPCQASGFRLQASGWSTPPSHPVTFQAYDLQLSPLRCICSPFRKYLSLFAAVVAVSNESFIRPHPFKKRIKRKSLCAVRSHGEKSERKAAEPPPSSKPPRCLLPVVWTTEYKGICQNISSAITAVAFIGNRLSTLGSTGVKPEETGLLLIAA